MRILSNIPPPTCCSVDSGSSVDSVCSVDSGSSVDSVCSIVWGCSVVSDDCVKDLDFLFEETNSW